MPSSRRARPPAPALVGDPPHRGRHGPAVEVAARAAARARVMSWASVRARALSRAARRADELLDVRHDLGARHAVRHDDDRAAVLAVRRDAAPAPGAAAHLDAVAADPGSRPRAGSSRDDSTPPRRQPRRATPPAAPRVHRGPRGTGQRASHVTDQIVQAKNFASTAGGHRRRRSARRVAASHGASSPGVVHLWSTATRRCCPQVVPRCGPQAGARAR